MFGLCGRTIGSRVWYKLVVGKGVIEDTVNTYGKSRRLRSAKLGASLSRHRDMTGSRSRHVASATPCAEVTTMISEAIIRELSITDLIHVLNEKIDLEWSRLLKTPHPAIRSNASVESEVHSDFCTFISHITVTVTAGSLTLTLQIKCLEKSARNILKLIPTLQNALRPVNKLPQELLIHIAEFILLDGNAVDAKPIIPLTHVCRRWRETIVSNPSNWGLVSTCSGSNLTALSLDRAKTSRLDLSINLNTFTRNLWPFHLTTAQLQNVNSLSIFEVSGTEVLTMAFPGFPGSIPNLRSLTLQCTYTSVRWDMTIDPFVSLSRTLKHISLLNVPLSPSLFNLSSLTELHLCYHRFDVHVDTLLTFLEGNHSLEKATLDIRFEDPSFRVSHRRTPIKNRLRHLSITCNNPINAQVLISNITLRRSAVLEILSLDQDTTLHHLFSGVSTAHLSNLHSPIFLEYQSYPRNILLRGPNGSFLFSCFPSSVIPFEEFSLFSLIHIREFRLRYHLSQRPRGPRNPPPLNPSSFPALETLAVECDLDLLHFLSSLISNPSAFPSLKTLAFLNCIITEGFMEKLARFASDRMNTASARLHQVVIVHENARFPTAAAVHALEKEVPVVDVRFGTELPADFA